MNQSPININRPRNLAVAALVLFGASCLVGLAVGKYTLVTVVTQKPRFSIFLYRSARDLYTISRMLNNQSELKRLAGYYGLYENGMVDTGFLTERLGKETSPTVRRTIIWLLSFSKDKNEALGTLSEAFGSGNPQIRAEVLRAMERLDGDYYADFIKKKGSERKKEAPGR